MKLAIGDVVRDRSDLTLGTMAGVTVRNGTSVVALCVSGGALRLSAPHDLEFVARRVPVRRRADAIRDVVIFVLAAISACCGAIFAQDAGAGLGVTAFATTGGFTTVLAAYGFGKWLVGPRRFRV
ncbi:hypothetical protein [Streptomyces microflavus]|uniref:hypothetical protein n=1 Tax=Streptomyces microflavus TaxID=1919 RepID=UPI003659E2C9